MSTPTRINDNSRSAGTMKWYNRSRGFGFVTPDGGGEDLFIHHTDVNGDQHTQLGEGDRVTFAVEQREKGPAAVALSLIDRRQTQPQAPAQRRPVRSAPNGNGSGSAFAGLGLNQKLLRAVREQQYTEPTPVQAQAIPLVLAGRDLVAAAQTGTGKTAAFALPILQRLAESAGPSRKGRRPIRALVVAPTRELAIQIATSFAAYGAHTGLTSTTIYGGVGQNPQVKALRRGVDVVVATPGRLLDLMGQGHVDLGQVDVVVLDEADRMLDMGFIHDVRRIMRAVPRRRQTLLFSATMPPAVVDLASSIMRDPANVHVAPEQPTVEAIDQGVFFISRQKKQALLEHVLADDELSRVLVFTRTKRGADKVVKKLQRAGISAQPIHGNKSQTARQRSLKMFRSGKARVLVATDVVARGIDVDEISHVIQYDLPNEPETYVHRIGRTGRAGAPGTALAFCSDPERSHLKGIERLLGSRVPVIDRHPYAG
ncbi:MAG: DEAD/DEAH box helicase [Candidatus Promineifilaceae bacterium]|nr:DEAD/DEAH box helicase [Candidatus Promineifilaceae bacterium]